MTLFIGYCIFTWIVGFWYLFSCPFFEEWCIWDWVLSIIGVFVFPILFPIAIGQLLRDKL